MKRLLNEKEAMRHAQGRHEDEPNQHVVEPNQHVVDTPVLDEGSSSNQDNPVTSSATSFEDAGEACIPDSQGRYGSSGGAHSQEIEYAYQLETTPEVVSQTLTFSIIPEIERRVSGIVVPIMFEEACGRPGTRRRRLLEADGFTSFPPDKIESNEQCEGTLSSSDNKCYVVSGTATVYAAELDASMLDRAREFVAKGMNEGMFDKIHEGIVDVSYHGGGTSNVSTTRSTGNDDSVNPVVIWAPIVGVVVAGALIGALFVWRNHKKRQRQDRRAMSTDPLGIRPSTREDFSRGEFDVKTKSSWDVLAQHSPNAKKEELGISARELVHSASELNRIGYSSWDIVQSPSQHELPVLGMATRLDGSGFIDTSGMHAQEEKWDDESVLTTK